MAVKRGGQKPILVTMKEKKFEITNPDKLMDHLGQKVKITGELQGEKILVREVESAK
jgi:hypothetical protein